MKPQSSSLCVASCAPLLVVVAVALGCCSAQLDGRRPTQPPRAAPKSTIDPIDANGPIFVEWPKPTLAIVFSGELDGYLEPCGCAGLENQLGGLKRRHTLLKQLAADGWPLVLLDLGGLTKRTGVQTEIKYRYALESLVEIGYQAVGLGANELKLSIDSLAYALGNVDPATSPIVSANVGVYGFDVAQDMGVGPLSVIEAGGKRIGVTAVLGATARSRRQEQRRPARTCRRPRRWPTWRRSWRPRTATCRCCSSMAIRRKRRTLSRQFPQFQIVATPAGPRSRPASSSSSRAATP